MFNKHEVCKVFDERRCKMYSNRRIRKACERHNDAQFAWHRAQAAVRHARHEAKQAMEAWDPPPGVGVNATGAECIAVAAYDLDAGAYWEWFERELDAQDRIN